MAENEDIEKVDESEGKKSLLANKKLLIIIAVTLLLIIVGLGAFLFLGSSDEPAAEVEATEEIEQPTNDPETLEDLPEEEMPDEEVSLELPNIPEESEPETSNEDFGSSRLAAISDGIKNPKPLFGGSDEDESATTDQSETDTIAIPEYDAEVEEEPTVPPAIQTILDEFSTPEKMAAEIAKLRRQVELNLNETTRLYGELGDMEDKLREKNRIIRAQDTAYLKGPKVSPKRNAGPIAPPEPTWEVSPQHTGP